MINYLTIGVDMYPNKEVDCFDIKFWSALLYECDYNEYRPIHSTDYEHYGFYGRPELFYMVGGFGWYWHEKDGKVIISAKDVYDWHPTVGHDGLPFYYVSPLPINWISEDLAWNLNKWLGVVAFSEGFEGTIGISNLFWEWLGGKEFTTYMKWEFNREQLEALYWEQGDNQ